MNKRAKILVVDDNATNILIFEEILEDEYDIATCTSGESALVHLENECPDLILLDIMMPGIDGYETCLRIRQNPALRSVKIILVSAKALTEERIRGYEVGADDYITKPFAPEELEAKIRVFLRLKNVEELQQLKTEALTLLNHGTRTPLTCIGSALELLSEYTDPDDSKRGLVDAAREGWDRLQTLLDRSLLLCDLRARNIQVEQEPLDVGTVLAEVERTARERAAARNITIEVGRFSGTIRGAHLHLRTAFRTLLDYALQNGALGSTMHLGADQVAEEVKVALWATGLDYQQARDFVEVVPTDVLHQRSDDDGLAMALCREIIEFHNGTLEAEAHPAGGSLLRVSLPAEVAKAA